MQLSTNKSKMWDSVGILQKPPLLVSIGLMIYNKTMKKNIVDHLALDGLSIHYDRVRTIHDNIAAQLL